MANPQLVRMALVLINHLGSASRLCEVEIDLSLNLLDQVADKLHQLAELDRQIGRVFDQWTVRPQGPPIA